ncbi:MAG: molybdenum ABC transporter ATP-binding protein [Magnetococcales bacterium]|nr:molybdenum ABC transporter ATP-binding protein [Magnetococcales bacterium]
MTIEIRFSLAWPGFGLDLDLQLPGQGITALFGHSGAGKTTLLRAIAGLERIPGGRLVVNGEIWQYQGYFLPTHRRPLGYVFQEASLFPHLAVRGNLEYGMRRVGGRDVSRMAEIIDLLGIGALLDRKPDRLSGGERQRVAIARALLTRPRLLLMDEPLAALDQERKNEILPYLEQLHAELSIPVFYVSHSPDEVARLADHLVVLDGGRVAGCGPLTDMLARLDAPIRLGEDAGVVLEAMVAERDAEWHLARVDFVGGQLWVRDRGLSVGTPARIRILARDVGLALERVTGTSIINVFAATVTGVAEEGHPAHRLVRLDAGGAPLLARVTARSVAALRLAPGVPVQAMIKAVALID